ncbi:MAG: hypothetical protein R3F04_02835 [Lysobacteraceae bacterium]
MRGEMVHTTRTDSAVPCTLDKVNRRFQADSPPSTVWKTSEAVELATLEWVPWVNTWRLLEPMSYIPPVEAETNYYWELASPYALAT